MAEVTVQQQLDEVRALLGRARSLFGANPVAPPADIVPDLDGTEVIPDTPRD